MSDIPYCVRCGRKSENHGAGWMDTPGRPTWCDGFTVYMTFACYQALFADGQLMVVEAPSIQFATAWLSGDRFPTASGGYLEGLVHDHGALINISLVPTKEWSKDPMIGGDNVLNVTNFRQRPTGLKCVGDDT